MSSININPYGDEATMPSGYPIADNLTTNSAQHALSAKQGKVLKSLIDECAQGVDEVAWEKSVRERIDNVTNIKWTALRAAPQSMSGSYGFNQGTTYEGVPYSSTREVDKYVGFNVSLRTFLTAVHNPYSMFYTENLHKDHSASAYGITYHADECGPYFGMQCVSFVSYCLGLPTYWLAHKWPYIASVGIVDSLGQPTAENVCLFDAILESGHARIVTDIQYANGSISAIVVQDSWPPLTRKNTYTPSSFNSTFNNSSFTLYRVVKKGLSVDSENVSGLEYNDDICTIAGDYACFRAGGLIGINYTLGNYTKMLVYRNGELVKTVNDLTGDSHLVNLTSDNLKQGLYTAVLSNADGSSTSKPTHFEVVDTNVGASLSGANVKVTFSSERGVPQYVVVADPEDGYAIAQRMLTDEERARGVAIVDASALKAAQPNSRTLAGSTIKVMFKGRYGSVTNEPVLSGL